MTTTTRFTTPQFVLGMLFSPMTTFQQLRHCRTAVALAPMLILSVAYSITFCVYYQLVDLPWLRDELTSSLEPLQRAAAQRHLTATALSIGAVIGAVLSTPIISLLYASYLYLAGQLMNLEHSYEEWLALVNWSSIPSLLFVPIAVTTMLASANGQVAPSDLNTTTVTQLWLEMSASSHWKPLLDSLNLLSLWGYALLGVGFHVWTRRSLLTSMLVPLAPAALILGIWAAVIAARSAA